MHVASDLLEKKSANTSDRFIPSFTEMYDSFPSDFRQYANFFPRRVGATKLTPFLQYGSTLKFHRKWIQSYLNTRVSENYIEEIEELEARRLLYRLLEKPKDFLQHLRTYVLHENLTSHYFMTQEISFTGAVILKLSHGYTISPEGYDTLVHLAEEALDNVLIEASIPGKWLVDIFPIR